MAEYLEGKLNSLEIMDFFKVKDIVPYQSINILHAPSVYLLIRFCQIGFRKSAPRQKSFKVFFCIFGDFYQRKRVEPVVKKTIFWARSWVMNCC
jgi:hypothetical protein